MTGEVRPNYECNAILRPPVYETCPITCKLFVIIRPVVSALAGVENKVSPGMAAFQHMHPTNNPYRLTF